MRIKGSLIIFVLLAIACSSSKKAYRNKTAQKVCQIQSDKKELFTLDKQDNWEIKHACGSDFAIYRKKADQQKNVDFLVSVKEANIPLKEYAEICKSWCEIRHKHAKFDKKIALDTILQFEESFTLKKAIKDKVLEGKRLVRYFKKGERIYVLSYTAPNKKDFYQYLSEVNKMIKSFRVVAKPIAEVISVKRKIMIDVNFKWDSINYFGDKELTFKRENIPLKESMDDLLLNVKGVIYNGTLYDFIKNKNDKTSKIYMKFDVEVAIENTKYGQRYVEFKEVKTLSRKTIKTLTHYYKVDNVIYQVSYQGNTKEFATYLGEAQQMMKSFKFIED